MHMQSSNQQLNLSSCFQQITNKFIYLSICFQVEDLLIYSLRFILIWMDPKIVDSEIKNQKIRQGVIYKRTKFLQEWRERWMVLTTNFILVFTNKNCKELTEYIDLRDVKSYKSYVRKDDEMIPAGFKIRTLEDMYYFCARNCNEKWTWMVSLERLMDFKIAGKSPYNNAEFIRTKGFMSQAEFQKGKFDDPFPKEQQKSANSVISSSTADAHQKDIQNLTKQLSQKFQVLKKKEEEFALKEKQQQDVFNFELNKLKESEESLKNLRLYYEEKIKEIESKAKSTELKTKEVLELLTQQEFKSGVNQKIVELAKSIAEVYAGVEIKTSTITEKPLDKINEPVIANVQMPRITSQPIRSYFIGPVSVDFIKIQEKVVNEPISQTIQEPVIMTEPIRSYFVGPISVNFIKTEQEVINKPTSSIIEEPVIITEPIHHYFIGPVSVQSLQAKVVIDEPIIFNIEQSLIRSQPTRVYFIGPLVVQTENSIQWLVIKSEETQQQIPAEVPIFAKESSKGSRVAQIKKMYESKISMENSRLNAPTPKTSSIIKEQKKTKDQFLHLCRQKVVVNLFQEFHAQAYTYTGLKPILQFLIQMTAERGLGYQQYVVSECKAHQNRFFFAQTLLELISDYHDYNNGDKLCKVIEVLIFEAPGIFKENHFDLIKRKLIDLFDHSPEESKIGDVLKTMHAVHKFKKFAQDEDLKKKLEDFIAGDHSQDAKFWAKKLLYDQ